MCLEVCLEVYDWDAIAKQPDKSLCLVQNYGPHEMRLEEWQITGRSYEEAA
jgi:hypothetical protein